MKKYLLSLLVAGISFIGFSNAYEYSDVLTYDCGNTVYESCEPSVVVPQDSIGVEILTKVDGNGVLSFSTVGLNGQFKQYQGFGVGTYMYDDNVGFLPKAMILTYFVAGGKITYRFIYPDTPIPPVFSGSNELLGSVISGLSSTVGEIISYFIYIGLGILIVSLGFVGMKWLMLYLYKKIRSKF